MGLDMYLIKSKRVTIDGEQPFMHYPENLAEKNPDLYEKFKPFEITIKLPNTKIQYQSYHEEVGYWRKANHIHNWFVQNVQDGVDDCDPHEVTKEKIDELLSLCKKVMKSKKLAFTFLPTQGGFFFGSTDYDDYYFDDIKRTIKILKSLKNFDYDNYVLCYQSSW